ncbi:MAG: triosephosphate isomerase [Gammaproteobacteria bacterium]|jgi:triosephosphate isomerase|nr:triosephosphate isomerase [Gammaproteobacteria bacterium]
MRQPMVAGNWKMHGSRESITKLLGTIKANCDTIPAVDLVVFPPVIFLQQVQQLLAGSKIQWGAQNVHEQPSGAYTGEIAAGMLIEFGCSHVLIGHSERRTLFNESDELLAKKFMAAQQQGLTPILCVGETLIQREQAQTEAVIIEQLNKVIDLAGVEAFNHAIIAYEPVWAIGTGKTATPEQAQQVHALIREQIALKSENVAGKLRILYGGSVKPDNAATLFKMPDIDGGLVGGASLDAQAFLDIAQCSNSYY